MEQTPDILGKLSGETKAFMLINEYRQRSLNISQLQNLLGILVNSDLEKMGILEMIRRLGPGYGLPPNETGSLIYGLENPLSGNTGKAEDLTKTQVQPGPGKTIRLTKFDTPQGMEPRANGQTTAPTFRVKAAPAVQPQPVAPVAAKTSGIPADNSKSDEMFYGNSGSSLATQVMQKMRDNKILLADDDARIRMVFHKRLSEAGYVVEEVDSGDKAWQKISENDYAVAIIDMKMPGLHGLELVERLTASGSKMPVIVCSAYEQLKDEFVLSTYPTLRYLVKPVALDKLLANVQELIAANR